MIFSLYLTDLKADEWEILKLRNENWNEVDLRDNRYDQIVHLVTAANGAEQFYSLENNITRTESIEVAREIDERCSKAWIGHPYIDVIDNCTDFDLKVTRALQVKILLLLLSFSSLFLFEFEYANANAKKKRLFVNASA